MNCFRAFTIAVSVSVAANALSQQIQIASVDEIAAWYEGSNKDGEVRRATRFIIRQQWTVEEAQRLNDVLVTSLQNRSDLEAKSWAVCELAQKHPESLKPALQWLIALLDMRHLASREITHADVCDIVNTLRSHPQLGTAAVPALKALKNAENKYPYASIISAAALARIQPNDTEPVAWLQSRLSGEHRAAVIVALGSIGPGAKQAIQLLEKLLDDHRHAIRTLAADALWKIEGNPRPIALKILCAAISEDPDDFATRPWGPSPPGNQHNIYAAYTLRSMGVLAKPAEPELLQIEKVGTKQQRQLASIALETIRSEAGVKN